MPLGRSGLHGPRPISKHSQSCCCPLFPASPVLGVTGWRIAMGEDRLGSSQTEKASFGLVVYAAKHVP